MKKRTVAHRFVGPFTVTLDQLEHLVSYVENELTEIELSLEDITVQEGDATVIYESAREFIEKQGWDRKVDYFKIEFRGRETPIVIDVHGGRKHKSSIVIGRADAALVYGVTKTLKTKLDSYSAWYSICIRGVWGEAITSLTLYVAIGGIAAYLYWVYLREEMISDGGSLQDYSWFAVGIGPACLVLSELLLKLLTTRSRIVKIHSKYRIAKTLGSVVIVAGAAATIAMLLLSQ